MHEGEAAIAISSSPAPAKIEAAYYKADEAI